MDRICINGSVRKTHYPWTQELQLPDYIQQLNIERVNVLGHSSHYLNNWAIARQLYVLTQALGRVLSPQAAPSGSILPSGLCQNMQLSSMGSIIVRWYWMIFAIRQLKWQVWGFLDLIDILWLLNISDRKSVLLPNLMPAQPISCLIAV